MTRNNVTPLFRHVANDTPGLWTTDELLWACFFTGLGSMLFTCGMALLWGSL